MVAKEMNWIIHYVIDTIGPGGIINAHTHGMEQYKHYDFQVVLNFPKEHIAYLLNSMGKRVQNGEKFSPGDLVTGIYETGRDVLRIIIPDRHNQFPESPTCEPKYKVQLHRAFEE